MNWTKTKIARWTAGAYRITEDADADRPFRLESAFDHPAVFGTLEEAKGGAAALRNELELVKADNERLRAELAEARGEWPDTSDLADNVNETRWAAADAAGALDGDEGDGRGIPPDADEEARIDALLARDRDIERNGRGIPRRAGPEPDRAVLNGR